jgi:hypothetical protein
MSSTDVNCLPVLKQRFTLDEFERIRAASHAVLGRVGNVVQLLEEAVLSVDEANIAELHVTRAVYGSSVSQRGELFDVQTLVGMRHGVPRSKPWWSSKGGVGVCPRSRCMHDWIDWIDCSLLGGPSAEARVGVWSEVLVAG